MAFVLTSGQLADLDRAPLASASMVELSTGVRHDYATIWRTQPNVRTVVSFLARNIAQLGVHVYRRVTDTDRERLTDHPLAQLISKPNPQTTRYRLIDSLVQDLGVYDNAYLLKTRMRGTAPTALLRLPPHMVTPTGDNTLLGATGYELRGSRGKRVLPPDQVVHLRGHNPVDSRVGSSPIETLRRILSEEHQAGAYREQLWRNGARFGGYLRRPVDAPEWSDRARGRFRADWMQQYTGDGPNAGGTPILEDGMEWVAGGMTPEQAQYLEARKLTREEVAAAYHIPLPMVGILDHATFSNIEQQHRQLYQDTLGPWLTMISEDLELQLLPDLPDNSGVYLEFNMAEKLRGSFEEQAQQLQTAVGAPWLTRNEARGRMNLPQLDGGNELVTPLNVLVGGQASPTDSGQNAAAPTAHKSRGVLLKAPDDDAAVAEAAALLQGFFGRQQRAVASKLGGKATADYWDGPRWDAELADDLERIARTNSGRAGLQALAKLGLDPSIYDTGRTLAWLRTHADAAAASINGAHADELADVLDAATEPPVTALRGFFTDLIEVRAPQLAATEVSAMHGFGTVEAVHQSGRTGSKTWRTPAKNPRKSHQGLNGQTVPVQELFGNGGRWPGDSKLPPGERCGCTCRLDVKVED